MVKAERWLIHFWPARDVRLLGKDSARAIKPIFIVFRKGFEGDDACFVFHDAGGFNFLVQLFFEIGSGFYRERHHFDLGFCFEELAVLAEEGVGTFLVVLEGREVLVILDGPVDMCGVGVTK